MFSLYDRATAVLQHAKRVDMALQAARHVRDLAIEEGASRALDQAVNHLNLVLNELDRPRGLIRDAAIATEYFSEDELEQFAREGQP
jgi:hypothetical protein